MNKRFFIILSILTLVSASIITYLFYMSYRNTGMPPGCRISPLALPGGCFAKFQIEDTSIAPETDCIKLSTNNCNNPSLTVTNTCGKELFVEDISIPPEVTTCHVPAQTWYIASDSSGKPYLSETKTCVDTSDEIRFEASIGQKPVVIDFAFEDGQRKKYYSYTPDQYEYCLDITRLQGDCLGARIEYSCVTPLIYGETSLKPKPAVCQTKHGEAEIVRYDTAPSEDTKYSFAGTLLDSLFTIHYTLTANKCD